MGLGSRLKIWWIIYSVIATHRFWGLVSKRVKETKVSFYELWHSGDANYFDLLFLYILFALTDVNI